MNEPLIFKDGLSAFQYACKHMNCSVEHNHPMLAIVLDARSEFGTSEAVNLKPDGIQIAVLRVASDDDGFRVIAGTAGRTGPELIPGDLVVWLPRQFDEKMGKAADDERFGWIGLITGTLEPEWENGSWTGKDRFSD